MYVCTPNSTCPILTSDDRAFLLPNCVSARDKRTPHMASASAAAAAYFPPITAGDRAAAAAGKKLFLPTVKFNASAGESRRGEGGAYKFSSETGILNF